MSPKHAFQCTWGMSEEAWEDKRGQLQALLVGVAASRATITYGEIAEIIFNRHFSPRSSALAQMLEEVCTIEDAAHDSMLGSVVVRADSGIPGKGYFVFAHEKLGRDFDPCDRQSCRVFWGNEVERVWSTYEGGSFEATL